MDRRQSRERVHWLSQLGWLVVPRLIHFVATVVWRLRIDYGPGFPEPPFVIAANHHSFLDPPIIGAVYRRRLKFLTLVDLFGKFRWLDRVLRTFEVIEVKRGALPLAALHRALEHLGNGGVIAVFPEGTRSSRFGDRPFALGAAWLAVRANVPVVPVAIVGAENALGVDNKLHRGRIKAFVGPAFHPDGTGRRAAEDLTHRWSRWIRASLGNRAG